MTDPTPAPTTFEALLDHHEENVAKAQKEADNGDLERCDVVFRGAAQSRSALLAYVAAKDALIQNLCGLLDASPDDATIRNNRAEVAKANKTVLKGPQT